MNARDPFNIRNSSPALNVLRNGAASLQQRAVLASQRIASTAQDNGKKGREDTPLTDETSAQAHGTAMSYALPSTGPTQRHQAGGANGPANGTISEKVTNMLGSDRSDMLPMYKDKPYQYPSSSKNQPWYRRRRTVVLILACLAGLSWWFGILSPASYASSKATGVKKDRKPWVGGGKTSKIDWHARAESVKDVFKVSWKGYEEHGWGMSLRLWRTRMTSLQ